MIYFIQFNFLCIKSINFFLLNFQFDITDKLPKYFCVICIDILNTSYQFKNQCEQTYNKLLGLWEKIDLPINVEIKEEYPVIDENVNFYEEFLDLSNGEDIKGDFSISEMNEMIKKVEKIFQPKKDKIKRKKPVPKYLKTYECYICSQTYQRRQDLVKHMKLKHNFDDNFKIENNNTANAEIPPKCNICDKTLSSRPNLRRHFRSVHLKDLSRKKPKIEVPCEKCGKLFASHQNKRRHILDIHEQLKPYECQICGNKFSQLVVLQSHMYKHSEIRNFKCDQCPKAFKTLLSLNTHAFIHLPKDEQPIRAKMRQYRTSLSNRVVQICEICGKSMTRQGLYYHMSRYHNDFQKKFECDVCSKKFAYKNELVVHNYTHTGERPHKCELCSKAFRQLSHLFEHRKTHTGAKPYKCRYCEKSFSMGGNLREHERIHTGETPYSCNLCPLRFANSKALRRHAKNMHPENEAEAVTPKTRGEVIKCSQFLK